MSSRRIGVVVLAVALVLAVLSAGRPAAGAPVGSPPGGAPAVEPGTAPHPCAADEPVWGYYWSDPAARWVQIRLCYADWGFLDATPATSIVAAGGTVTVSAVATDGSNNVGVVPITGGASWSYPGTLVSGCTTVDVTCTFKVGDPQTVPTEWSWLEVQVAMPRIFFIDSPGEFCAGQHYCAGNTTYAWAYVAIQPRTTAPTTDFAARFLGAPGEVSFLASSQDSAGSTFFHDWDFGDGTTGVRGDNPEHTYTEPGTYSVTLTASTLDNRTATKTKPVAIKPPRLSVDVSFPSKGEVGVGVPDTKLQPGEQLTARVRVAASDDGVGPLDTVTVDPVLVSQPTDAVSIAAVAPRAPFSLQPGEHRDIDVPIQGARSGRYTLSSSATARDGTGALVSAAGSLPGEVAGLRVDIDASVAVAGEPFVAVLTVQNPYEQDVTRLTFTPPEGVGIERLENLPDDGPVTLSSGPKPALPTTLAPGQSKQVTYRFATPRAGRAILEAAVAGTLAGVGDVQGDGALTVEVSEPPVTQEDRDRVLDRSVESLLTAGAPRLDQLESGIGSEIQGGLQLGSPTPGQIDSVADVTLPAELGGLLDTGPGFREQAGALLSSFATGFAKRVDVLGEGGGQAIYAVYNTLWEDPEARSAFAGKLIEAARALPADTLANAGYLGKAMLVNNTPEGLSYMLQENAKALVSIAEGTQQVVTGEVELAKNARRDYAQDPVRFMQEMGDGLGAGSADVCKEVMLAVLSEVGLTALRGTPAFLKGGGLKALTGETESQAVRRASRTVAAEGAVGDEGAAAALREARADAVMTTVQELEYGTELMAADGVTGFLAEDAVQIQSIIEATEARFGVEIEIGARTSEPLSRGIQGVAKPEVIKPKATSSLDMLLGADPATAGKVGVFRPVELSEEVLAGLEARQPGFRAKYDVRLASQKKLATDWFDKPFIDWETPGSAIRQLEHGSMVHPDGITALLERPGNPLPYDLKYIEQLDEEAFRAAKGISEAEAAAVKQDLQTYVGRYKLKLQAVENAKGFTLLNDGKPFVSDLDLQYVRLKGGAPLPQGLKGNIETFVNGQLQKVKRFPFHGYSDAANDLVSQYAEVADSFRLATARPGAEAQALAESIVQRNQRQAAIKLRRVGDLEQKLTDATMRDGDRQRLLDRIDKLRKEAEKLTKKDAAQLLADYPPGEKIVVFTKGRIVVGSQPK
jgi:PKD repeat protein